MLLRLQLRIWIRILNRPCKRFTKPKLWPKHYLSQPKRYLVFPNIVKAGLVFGGSDGEGELIEYEKVIDYYHSVTGSWGLAGAQSYGYVVFL